MSELLGRIVKGKIKKPPRIIVAGVPGVGKSTLASQFPEPLFIDAERRTEHIDTSRVEVDSWDDVLGVMREVYALAKKNEAPCKTLVFDTLDHIELLICAHVCKKHGKQSMEDWDWGKGYAYVLDEWQVFVSGMEKLRDMGIACLLVAHSNIKQFKNPEGEDYDQWTLKLSKKAVAYLREKVDAIGFAKYEDFIKKDPNTKQSKAKAGGRRIICFAHSPAFESKQGLGLPDSAELSYAALKPYLES